MRKLEWKLTCGPGTVHRVSRRWIRLGLMYQEFANIRRESFDKMETLRRPIDYLRKRLDNTDFKLNDKAYTWFALRISVSENAQAMTTVKFDKKTDKSKDTDTGGKASGSGNNNKDSDNKRGVKKDCTQCKKVNANNKHCDGCDCHHPGSAC
ncbi:hypothetical protein VTI74DRAFT_941 [Chaetomium olivicolor]